MKLIRASREEKNRDEAGLAGQFKSNNYVGKKRETDKIAGKEVSPRTQRTP
jgi:hypothetical protein